MGRVLVGFLCMLSFVEVSCSGKSQRHGSQRPSRGGSGDDAGSSTGGTVELDAISAGRAHACGIRSDTKGIICWGSNDYGESTVPSGPFIALSAGNAYTCAIDPAYKLHCWGYLRL